MHILFQPLTSLKIDGGEKWKIGRNMESIIFIKPNLKDKIWGGRRLESEFGFDLPTSNIGEAWLISAHPEGPTEIIFPDKYAGLSLKEFYDIFPELFGLHHFSEYPLLVKLLDAQDNLSIQVHPDDDYANKYSNTKGKNESWLIIDALPNSKIVLGHNALTQEAFLEAVQQASWDTLLRKVPVKKGDFFYVPSGTIHSIGAGILLLEIQQSSDITYRLYDYERRDSFGNLRPLHLKEALKVTTIPYHGTLHVPVIKKIPGGSITSLLKGADFSVFEWSSDGTETMRFMRDGAFTQCTVIEGRGDLIVDDKAYELHKGQSFILLYGTNKVSLQGRLKIVASNPEIE